MKAWHFVGATLRDGRPVPPDGEWLEHPGPVKMCDSGLHASRRILDALDYAPGATICRVECDDIHEEQEDKIVCTRRRILWRVDGEDVLHDFARRCAMDVIGLWDAPDVVREYLATGDDSLRDAAWDAAWAAARAAARDAARDAVRDAARGALRAAARAAAQAAARDAARDAAWDAAWAAAWDAAWAAARAASQAAAWAAARVAARAAARDRQNRRLTGMVAAAPRVA